MAPQNDLVPMTTAAHVTNEPSAYGDKSSKASDATFVNDRTILFVPEGGNNSDGSFTTPFSFSSVHEVLMVLKDTSLYEHGSFHGGDERHYHRGANGCSRFVTCKEDSCDKTVIRGSSFTTANRGPARRRQDHWDQMGPHG